jgi:SAM-dependent methyltransferase
MELLLGCGHSRQKRVWRNDEKDWEELVALDMTHDVQPDVVADIASNSLPFKDNSFDEIHAYEVLEHMGQQGDWKFFFAQFDEFARILKPSGCFYLTTPKMSSQWVWGDPGHTRFIGPQTLYFLDRDNYQKNMSNGTSMTDYRPYFNSDWITEFAGIEGESNVMMLRNRKGN